MAQRSGIHPGRFSCAVADTGPGFPEKFISKFYFPGSIFCVETGFCRVVSGIAGNSDTRYRGCRAARMDPVVEFDVEAEEMDPIFSQSQRIELPDRMRNRYHIGNRQTCLNSRFVAQSPIRIRCRFFCARNSMRRGVGANDCERRYKGIAQSTAIDRTKGTRKFALGGRGATASLPHSGIRKRGSKQIKLETDFIFGSNTFNERSMNN